MDLDWTKVVSLVLGSGLLSSLLTSFFGKINNDKNIRIENVTKERKIWRDKIRSLTASVNKEFYNKTQSEILFLISEFETRLNPIDAEDKNIIDLLYKLTEESNSDNTQLKEFNHRISLLLKHDWERIKFEISSNRLIKDEPTRILFSKENIQIYKVESKVKFKSYIYLIFYFITLMFASAIIFFLATGLNEPFQEIIKVMNDTSTDKSIADWFKFIIVSVIVGSMWAVAYLWFKGSEKRFLEIWFKR